LCTAAPVVAAVIAIVRGPDSEAQLVPPRPTAPQVERRDSGHWARAHLAVSKSETCFTSPSCTVSRGAGRRPHHCSRGRCRRSQAWISAEWSHQSFFALRRVLMNLELPRVSVVSTTSSTRSCTTAAELGASRHHPVVEVGAQQMAQSCGDTLLVVKPPSTGAGRPRRSTCSAGARWRSPVRAGGSVSKLLKHEPKHRGGERDELTS
jgi:hypothetical protein